jgi:hypothetical protein
MPEKSIKPQIGKEVVEEIQVRAKYGFFSEW